VSLGGADEATLTQALKESLFGEDGSFL
jgi:hypothetical protein